MEKNRCPACGSTRYNRLRCPECFYAPFTEEITHGNHTHEGEPLILKTAPAPLRREKGCKSFPRKRKRGNPLLILAGIWLAISVFIPLVEYVGYLVTDRIFTEPQPEPEPVAFVGGTVLFDNGEIQITADWQDGSSCDESIWIQVDNGTDRDVFVSAERMSINGYMTDSCFFYCSAEEGRLSAGDLWLDKEELAEIGIDTVAEISFRLNIYDAEIYDTLAVSDQITFYPAAPEDFVQSVDDSGTEVYCQDGIRIVYQGLHGETLQDAFFRFYIENTTSHSLDIYTEEAGINGESADLFLWSELMPNTRCITEMDLYALEESGLASPEDIHSLELILGITDSDDWSSCRYTDKIHIDPKGNTP